MGATRLTPFLQTTPSSDSLHISFTLSPSLTSSKHCLTGLARDLSPSTIPCLHDCVCEGSLHSHHMSKPSVVRPRNNLTFLSTISSHTSQYALQLYAVSPSWVYAWCKDLQSYFPMCTATLRCISKLGVCVV